MAERRSRLPLAALGFAAAAALSAWNPLSAPFGLVVGLAALVLALVALVRGGARAVSGGAAVLSAAAVIVSVLVLALTAGVGRELRGDPIVRVPPRGDVDRTLEAAGKDTRAARDRARAELDALGEPKGGGAERQAPPRKP